MKHTQKGLSMIEVLITIVIVSFGLLGIAGIIVNSMKSAQSSYARSQATLLANDIIDRMRANRATAEANPSPYSRALSASTPSDNSVPSADLASWRTALASTLPSGTGSVTYAPATNKVTVTVQWNNSRVAGGVASEQISIETRL